MDQFCPKDSNDDKGFTIPLLQLHGKEGGYNLLISPGGPGPSVLSLICRRGKLLSEAVGDDFHAPAFDPRGGASETLPAAVCFPNQNLHERRAFIPSYDLKRDISRVFAWATNYTKACANRFMSIA